MTYAAITTIYKGEPKPLPDTKPNYQLIWKEIPGEDHNYAGRMDEIIGTPTPPGWQEGWSWNGYIAVKE
jgi:hypothetical protein